MNSTEINAVFKIGDNVVYPLQGVGCILAKEMRNTREYYRVQINSSDMDVLLPVDTAQSLGLRHLASATEARKAISSLSVRREMGRTDWKQRLILNQELMKEGSMLAVAKVVNSLYHRSKVKELPVQERKLYDSALTLLVDESSSVLGIDQEEMKKKIFSTLTPSSSSERSLENIRMKTPGISMIMTQARTV